MSKATADHAGLEVLTDREAVRLLSSRNLGRLAFAHDGWPVIVPVNYIYREPTIVLRTGSGAKLDEVAFSAFALEVDDTDPDSAWGWSVLVQGPAFDITDAGDERSLQLRALPVRPWAPGAKDHWITVAAVNLSGRRFGQVPP